MILSNNVDCSWPKELPSDDLDCDWSNLKVLHEQGTQFVNCIQLLERSVVLPKSRDPYGQVLQGGRFIIYSPMYELNVSIESTIYIRVKLHLMRL